jgi:hypothetical protein
VSGGTGTAELRGCGVIDLHYHSEYSGCLFCFELEMGWDGMNGQHVGAWMEAWAGMKSGC